MFPLSLPRDMTTVSEGQQTTRSSQSDNSDSEDSEGSQGSGNGSGRSDDLDDLQNDLDLLTDEDAVDDWGEVGVSGRSHWAMD